MFPKIEIIYSLLFRYKNFETGRFFLYLILPPTTTTTQHNNPIIICHNGIRVIWLFYFLETEKNSIYFQLIFVGKNLFLFSHLANRRINARQSLLRYLRISNWIFEPISPKSESIAFIIINLNSRTSITVACLIVKHLKIGKKMFVFVDNLKI